MFTVSGDHGFWNIWTIPLQIYRVWTIPPQVSFVVLDDETLIVCVFYVGGDRVRPGEDPLLGLGACIEAESGTKVTVLVNLCARLYGVA